jgi:hypothetical protein
MGYSISRLIADIVFSQKPNYHPVPPVNTTMDINLLIDQGNQHRTDRQYEAALACYAQALTQDRRCAAAFNNYGNVLREIGEPAGALPFLERAIQLNPHDPVANFNRAVCLLLQGDYSRGWPAYESRWNYEHLANTLPQLGMPRWRGEDLKNKSILVIGEQGHGDCIQFSRFLWNLHALGAQIHLQVTDGLIPLFQGSPILASIAGYDSSVPTTDYWSPIMSLPGIMGITLENLPRPVNYITARDTDVAAWRDRLGAKTRLRAGLSWSGRRDAWLNQHKGMPFESALTLVRNNPQIEWVNLQIDATDSETQALSALGVRMFPGTIGGFHDTAALITHMDVVISVDTAIAHLSGALGRPTWVMLQKFALDWRWLLDRADSPWYSTARLFRQRDFDDWLSVINQVTQYLSWFKV